MKKVFVVIFYILFCSSYGRALDEKPQTTTPSFTFNVGEELLYNVRYSFISLGSVKMNVVEKFKEDGVELYRVQSLIDSYSGVPFVDLHVVYESHIDEEGFPHRFIGRTLEGDHWAYIRYDFDRIKNKIYIQKGIGTKEEFSTTQHYDTLSVSSAFQDGLSIFYYARRKSGSIGFESVPTFQDQKQSTTDINWTDETDDTGIGALKYDVDTKIIKGTANFIGVFGLTGGFSGWFSNDEARVPIIAKLKVLIGSITLELKEWKRGAWAPPEWKDN